MAVMGLVPIYQRPRTTVSNPEHRIWPYLLRGVVIDRPHQVWCTDLTYIPNAAWLSLPCRGDGLGDQEGAVLAGVEHDGCGVLRGGAARGFGAVWSAQNLQLRPGETAKRFARGSQFTSPRFTGILQQAGVRISMDGRGRWMDNVFISGYGAA